MDAETICESGPGLREPFENVDIGAGRAMVLSTGFAVHERGITMKVLCAFLVLFLTAAFSPVKLAAQGTEAAQNVLTNKDVADLMKTGLSTEVIVAKIRTSTCKFDTSPAALKQLKDAGIPDAVILAMVDPSSKSASSTATPDLAKSDNSSDSFAHVRVYRPRLLPGNNFNPPISVDDKEVFKIGNARRCSVKIDPGHHVITSDDKSSRIEIDAKPGQEFYVSVQELPGGFLKGRGKLTLMSNEQGRPEYKLEKPLEEDKKVAKDMVEEDAGTM
jgi:hypothetical protein